VEDLAPEHLAVVLYGTRGKRFPFVLQNDHYGRRHEIFAPFEGIINNLSRRHRETNSEHQREELEQYMSSRPCPACRGARLKPEALAVKVGDRSITEITRFSVLEAQAFFHGLQLTGREEIIARQVLKEIQERLGFLINVGLDYLTLDRGAGTLSGGEAQRIRLATQIGSGLMGVLYILDEPSIGLHQRDNQRLLRTLERLRDLGNTLIVVEHDEDTMLAADHIIDIGPGAGEHGGRVVATGTYRDIMENPESVTGQYLCGKRVIPAPQFRRRPNGRALEVLGACENNLKNIDVVFPLNLFTCVTGVSGSGKSTLVNDILYRKLAQELHRARTQPGRCREVRGIGHLDKVIDVNQSPIGRTPRSNPATYTGVFNDIRDLFAQTPESKMRGYKPGRFSFNVKGGRCEACQGDGIIKIEMHFLPDVYVPCEVCKGRRYNRETLEVRYKGKNIADVLDMTVEQAVEFFLHIPRIHRKLNTLYDVGLGYIRLGQPATTLSGGEAQRVKLATELSRRSNGKTFYILDEPTTGLHAADIDRLLKVLHRLVEAGDTVVVIEHNLDVIKTADYIIDLGPEGGDRGGEVVAAGTPEEIAAFPGSYTGQFLRKALEKDLRAGDREK
jgi:excinuclease ABC subunit A